MATVEPKIKQIRLSDGEHDIDLPSTAQPSITSLNTSGDVTVGGKLVTGHIEAPSAGSNDTVSIDDRLAVSSTSNFNGDVFVGGWEQLTPGGSWTPITGDTDSLRVNGTFTTNGEIDTNGHTINVGAINCDEIEAGNSTVYCGAIYSGEIHAGNNSLSCGDISCNAISNSGSTASFGGTTVSSLTVNGTSTLTGNITCNGTFNGKDASYSASVTVGGTTRTNGELKTHSVFADEDNKYNLGKSGHGYKQGLIYTLNTNKVVVESKVTMQYNSTDDCLDFIFS